MNGQPRIGQGFTVTIGGARLNCRCWAGPLEPVPRTSPRAALRDLAEKALADWTTEGGALGTDEAEPAMLAEALEGGTLAGRIEAAIARHLPPEDDEPAKPADPAELPEPIVAYASPAPGADASRACRGDASPAAAGDAFSS